MSRRSVDLLIGVAIVALLVWKALDIVIAGLVCAWWVARHSVGDPRVQDVARAAMLGGVVARILMVAGMLVLFPPAFASYGLSWASFLLGDAATMTGITILLLGTMTLVEAFLLGVSVRLLGPWLPR